MAAEARFERIAVLGRGNTGVVYRARDSELGRDVALKALTGVSPDRVQRLKLEFRMLRDAAHPNLVQLYDLVVSEADAFFTMELVDGVDLLQFVRGGAPAEAPLERSGLERVQNTFGQLAGALEALHAFGIVHRDLKPSNVTVARDGRVVVLDFGLAASLVDAGALPQRFAGTLPYMAPEQIWGSPATPAMDWYAFGALLFEALVGVPAFAGIPETILRRKSEAAPIVAPRFTCDELVALRDVVAALLHQDPARRPHASDVHAALGSPDRPSHRVLARPFVGREHEVGTLLEWLERVRLGSPLVGHVVGPSGIGKSAVLKELRSRANDALVLSSRCLAREIVPYNALDGAIEQMAQSLQEMDALDAGVEGADVTALLRLFPVLQSVDALARAQGSIVEGDREIQRRGFDAFRALVRALARDRPVVLCIDDAQWGDRDSALAIVSLLRGPDLPRVMLLLAYREDEAEASSLLRGLERGDVLPDATLQIRPLAEGQARALAAELLRRDPSDGAVARVVEQFGRWILATGGHGDMPDLGDVILGRLDALGPGARSVAELAALGGTHLDIPSLLGLAGSADATLIYRMRESGLLRTVVTRPNSVEPYHDRIRDIVCESIPVSERSTLHRRIADQLHASGSPDPEALLEHLIGAGDESGAAIAAEQAGDRAVRALAFSRAADLYRTALGLRRAERPDWQLVARHAEALANAGRGVESGGAYQMAADTAASAGAAEAQRLALRAAGARELLCAGDMDGGLRALRRTLAEAGLSYPRSPAVALGHLLATRVRLAMRGLDFVERAERDAPPDALARIDASWAATMGLNSFDAIRSATFQARHTVLALDAGEVTRVVRALAAEAVYRAAEGGRRRRETAAALVGRLHGLASNATDPRVRAFAQLCAGVASYFGGEWTLAVERLAEAERFFQTLHGVGWELGNCRFYRLCALASNGDVAALNAQQGQAMTEARIRSDAFAELTAASGHANLVWLIADTPDEARMRADAAIGRFRTDRVHSPHYADFIAQQRVDLYLGHAWAAWKRACEMLPKLRRVLLLRLQLFRIETAYLTAAAALAAAATREPPPTACSGWSRPRLLRVVRRTSRRLAAEDSPVGPLLGGLLDAALTAQDGRTEESSRQFSAVADALAAHGTGLYAAAARHHAARLSGLPAPDAPAGVAAPGRLAAMLVPGVT